MRTALTLLAVLLAHPALAQCNNPGPDVIPGDIGDVSNFPIAGGYDALALGVTLCNIGSAPLSYTGCTTSTNHPVIGAGLFRYTNTGGPARFEQVGISWLKHVSTVVNESICCTCTPSGGSLGIGCSDVYNSAFQGFPRTLGPRSAVNAYTGTFTPGCPTGPINASGTNMGLLEVAVGDLTVTPGGPPATTRYFGEQAIVAHDDATFTNAAHPVPVNGLNNASHVEVTVGGSASNYTFALMNPVQRSVPAIRRWKQIDPTVTESTLLVPGEGEFILASKATALGGTPPMWRYEYALYNLNSDRCAGTFSVPLPAAAVVLNPGFHGVAYRGGDGLGGNYDSTPWLATRSDRRLTWATTEYSVTTNANALRWGTMYNFRFDASVPPGPDGLVTIGLWKPGSPFAVTAMAQLPLPPCGDADFDNDGDVGADADIAAFFACLAGNCCQRCDSVDFNNDGDVATDADIEAFFRVLAGGSC